MPSSTSTSERWRLPAIALASVAAVLLAAEIVLRLLPVSTATMLGYHVDEDVLSYPPHHEWTVSTGWDLRNPQRLRSNNWGFPSDRDFDVDPSAVALIGDSYVEASMLDASDRPAAQLESMLDGRRVYGLGSPGTALLDYAQRVRFASQNFGINRFVVWLGAGDARQALCGSGNVHSRCLDPVSLAQRIERWPEPSAPKRLARHSALAQYLAGQLKIDGRRLAGSVFRRSVPEEPVASDAGRRVASAGIPAEIQARTRVVVEAALERFFEDIRPYAATDRIVFLLDGQDVSHMAGAALIEFERELMLDGLRRRGADVVDLRPVYRAHEARSPLSLEVGPYDGHLNALGVRLTMEQAALRLPS